MRSITCMVTGHRDIPADKREEIRERLRGEIERAIADGYTRFLFGFADGADMLFASIVAELKQSNEALWLLAAVPYPGRLRQLEQDPEAVRLMEACDSIGVHSRAYTPDCFHVRNRGMVEEAGRCIAVYDGRTNGGTLYTMSYAKDLGLEVRVIQY